MAKNWNVKDFTNVIMAGGDEAKAAILDAGRRFPLTVTTICQITASTGANAFAMLASGIPDWATLRKIEGALKGGVEVSDDDETDEAEPEVVEEEEEKPAKKAKKEKAEKPAKKEKVAKKAKKVEEEPEEEAEEEAEEEEEPKKAKKVAKEEEDEDEDDGNWDL